MLNISFPHQVKISLIIVGWGTSLSAITVGTIFQGFLLPTNGGGLLPEIYGANPLGLWVFYLGVSGISVVAAVLISDVGTAVVSSFVSFGLAALTTFIVLALPELIGTIQTPGVVQRAAVQFTFSALFPMAFFLNFIGTVAGCALGERLL